MSDPAGEGMEYGALLDVLRARGLRKSDKVIGIMLSLGYADRGLFVNEVSPGVKAVYTSAANKGNDDVRH